MIVAVIVTYNRLELLKRVITALKSQTVPVDKIIVVNNGATDGTKEWLDSQEFLITIHQENVGGAGGFYRGIKEAMTTETDWIWCMDDDVFPTSKCLEKLINHYTSEDRTGILCPKRLMDGRLFISETRKQNLSNPFKYIYEDCLKEELLNNNETVEIEGMAFEGPLIRREVVESIGLPNKDLFILYDDTEYSYRAILAGYKVKVVSSAVMEKYNHQSTLTKRDNLVKNKWKLKYHFRNTAYFCHKYGKNFFFRYLGTLPFVIDMYGAITYNFFKGHKYSVSDYFMILKMIRRGIKGKLGKM